MSQKIYIYSPFLLAMGPARLPVTWKKITSGMHALTFRAGQLENGLEAPSAQNFGIVFEGEEKIFSSEKNNRTNWRARQGLNYAKNFFSSPHFLTLLPFFSTR